MAAVVSVRSLAKRYADVEALKGIDFDIHEGEVFGLLGPNGAGKTTTIEILEGLRMRSSGDVRVLGFDPANDSRKLKDRIGVCLQATRLAETKGRIIAMARPRRCRRAPWAPAESRCAWRRHSRAIAIRC